MPEGPGRPCGPADLRTPTQGMPPRTLPDKRPLATADGGPSGGDSMGLSCFVRPCMTLSALPGCLESRQVAIQTAGLTPYATGPYSTVTDLAKLRGWSMSVPLSTAIW
jgi:hypothetical protein